MLSRRIIEKQINKSVYGFAYPYGQRDNFNAHIKEIVRSAGFLYASSARTGIISNDSNVYSLKRIAMPDDTAMAIMKICKFV